MGAKANGIGWKEEKSPTLLKEMVPAVIAWDKVVALNISNGVPSLDDTMGTLDTDGASTTAIGAQTRGVVIGWNQELNAAEELMGTLKARVLGGGHQNGVIAFHHTQTPISGDVAPSVGRTTNWMGVFVDPGMESWKAAEVIEPMCARDYKDAAAIILPTLAMGAHTAGPGGNGQDALQIQQTLSAVGVGRPRRLTPLECERLMSWPDQWTATGRKADGTLYALSDTARYRLCGNGVGSVCAQWIAGRFLDHEAT